MTLALRAASPSSHRHLAGASDDYARRVGRVSPGLRIVRAADDAAGLAIAQKLRAGVNGSAMAARNVQDAVNLLSTAEGGLDGVTSLLHRARETVGAGGQHGDDDGRGSGDGRRRGAADRR